MSVKYRLLINTYTGEPDTVNIVGTNLYIPFDPANTDYQAYLKWLEAGNIPEPADE